MEHIGSERSQRSPTNTDRKLIQHIGSDGNHSNTDRKTRENKSVVTEIIENTETQTES